MSSTVVIRTIGRSTLRYAIESCNRERFPVIVVSDGVEINTRMLPPCRYYKLGRRFGVYGAMAQNVGAYMAETPYVTFVDDDDELKEGSGDFIRAALAKNATPDIWIPGLIYNDGKIVCLRGSAAKPRIGTVAVPTYKVQVFTEVPFVHSMGSNGRCVDFWHVDRCVKAGCKLAWFGEVLYLVRPKLDGPHGHGLLGHPVERQLLML